MAHAIEKLAEAIGYPDRVPGGVVSFAFRVDGMEVIAEETDGRLVLSLALTGDETLVPALASYAAGRMLREDATLAFGSLEDLKSGSLEGEASKPPNLQPSKLLGSATFLWQDAPAGADAHALRRLFETFMDSCDWWRARVDALRGGSETAPVPETMMIRP